MAKRFQLIPLLSALIITAGQASYGQNRTITFTNDLNAYYNKERSNDSFSGKRFFEPRINEIELNPDKTFEFWSRPDISCATWQSYKGTWKKDKDSVFFMTITRWMRLTQKLHIKEIPRNNLS